MSAATFIYLILALGFLPCATEDSKDCYWIASIHGNGQGTSFININGEVIPVSNQEL